MSWRGFGVVEASEQHLPAVVREAFAVLTQLGDAWFVFAAVALLYWFGDRRRGAFALSAVLGAMALTLAAKGLFALPRPPASLHVGHASGYGFPSGHAIGATVLWGLLALAVERDTPHRRAMVAAIAVAVVASSRVVIGVHYAGDVLVGVVVGLAYLAVLVRAIDWRPAPAFVAAAALALAAVVTNGLTPDAVATVAGVLGAGAAWVAVGESAGTRVEIPAALVGLAVLGAVGYAGNEVVASLPVVFVLNAIVPAGIVVLPVVTGRARKAGSETVT